MVSKKHIIRSRKHLIDKMDVQDCKFCRISQNKDFKQVANLRHSGLMIYIHGFKSKQKICDDECCVNNVILHNTSNKDIKRFDYIVELCQYRTKCLRCKMLIERVRNVIEDISIINKNEVLGVCDFCKRPHQKNKCQRCQYIVDKFIQNKMEQNIQRKEQFRLWLSKIQNILLSILESKVICKHNIYLDNESKQQLYRLLNSMDSPLPRRQPEIDLFPELFDVKETEIDVSDKEKILEDLITQFQNKIDYNSELEFMSGSESESDCICKYFGKNRSDDRSAEISTQEVALPNLPMTADDENKTKTITTSAKFKNRFSLKSEDITNKQSSDTKSQTTKTYNKNKKVTKAKTSSGDVKTNVDVKTRPEKAKKQKESTDYSLMLHMLKTLKKDKKESFKLNIKQKKQLPMIKDLPIIKAKKNTAPLDASESESILECKDLSESVNEVIRGTKIGNFDPHYQEQDIEGSVKLPILYSIKTDLTIPPKIESVSLPSFSSRNTKSKYQKITQNDESGVIKYKLSDREFIDKGWTKLPSTKIMRRINIYKMLPTPSELDWYKIFKNEKVLFYDTGEVLAEIYETGSGKWYYKNGKVALAVSKEKEANVVKRYVVYSSGEEIVTWINEPITILACFDYLGNGVVYDYYGNVRLKYNQSEGELMDNKIAPPCRWKWHTLNDPLVLQQAFIDTFDKSDNSDCFKKYITPGENIKKPNEEMISIERDNLLKEKANKLRRRFQPFQIRIKVLKINNFFSLRIIDQANIFLLYRCGRVCLKLNIGMLLKSDEIIDTDISEVSEVSTPYDHFPLKSESLSDIQNTLNNTRKRHRSSKRSK